MKTPQRTKTRKRSPTAFPKPTAGVVITVKADNDVREENTTRPFGTPAIYRATGVLTLGGLENTTCEALGNTADMAVVRVLRALVASVTPGGRG